MTKQKISFSNNLCLVTQKCVLPKKWACFVILLAFVCSSASCELDTIVDAEHEPVLQIDTVFFSDEPLPVIRVRQSYRTARKGGKFLVDRETLQVSGADIELHRNGEPVSVTEEAPGHYRPDVDVTTRAGDHFEIYVRKDGMQAKAVAVVPDHPVDNIVIEPAGEIEVIGARGDLAVQFHFPFMPEFAALRVYSEEDREEGQGWNHTLNSGSGNLSYQAYYGRDHHGEEQLSVTHSSTFVFPHEEEDLGQQKTILFPFYVDIVIPEPIYETWHRHRTNYGDFTPLTVTNVEGGVGMFIGAIRMHVAMQTEITLHYKAYEWDF